MNKVAKKLYNENWRLCHDIVDARDGRKCIICGSRVKLQLDHCITRAKKSVFFETDGLNYLCSRCHTTKSFQHGSPLDKEVDNVTRQRLGVKGWYELIMKAKIVCPMFSTVSWQEACNEQLKEELEFVKSVRELKGWKS